MKILSFDIEDWFHIFDPAFDRKKLSWENRPSRVEQETEWLLSFLENHQLKATFFCLGWVAEKHPQLINKIHLQRHDLAAHSYLHQKVYQLSTKEFEADAEKSIKILEDITGEKVTAYRAPGFSFNDKTKWAFNILHKLGITEDSSFKSGLIFNKIKIPNEPFFIKGDRFSMKEFPTRTFPIPGANVIYSGSGYFRLFPYQFIKSRFNASDYEMSYFHPRDFDNSIHQLFHGHPLLQLRYRLGTGRSGKNLETFVNDFQFITLSEANKMVDWDKAPVIQIGEFY